MLRWTAGHTGIVGNEEADDEAKKAAEGLTSDEQQLPKLLRKTLKRSKSAAIQEEGAARMAKWRREWRGSPRSAKFKFIDSSLPSCRFIKLISNTKITRADASKMFQLCSGHIPLNAYLFRFMKKENAQCPACGARKEMPQHFLLECPAYKHKRRKLGPKKGELEKKFVEVISSEKKIVALAQYIQATGRFTEAMQDKASKVAPNQMRTRKE